MKIQKAIVLIELSINIEEANRIIEEEIGITELTRKIKFLQENFDIQMIGHSPQTEDDYNCMLNAIIKQKYRK